MSRSSVGNRSRKRYACVVAESMADCVPAIVGERGGEKAPSGRERRIQRDGLARDGESAILAECVESHRLAVLSQRVEGARGRLCQRRRRVHRAQRFASLASQLTRELVGRVDQTARTVARFAERRQLSARVGADEPDRHDVAAGHARDVAVDDRLDAAALCDLSRDRRVDASVRRTLHEPERGHDLRRLHERERRRSRETGADGVAHDAAKGRVHVRRAEVGEQNRVALIQMSGREQRSERSDAERAQPHEHGDRRDEERRTRRSRLVRFGTSSCAAQP